MTGPQGALDLRCQECGRQASHTTWLAGIVRCQCCACYVEQGNPPADWHDGCMAAWERRQRVRGWMGGFYPDQHPDPFPSFAATTDDRDWAWRDAEVWFDEMGDDDALVERAILRAHDDAVAYSIGTFSAYEWYVYDALRGLHVRLAFRRTEVR